MKNPQNPRKNTVPVFIVRNFFITCLACWGLTCCLEAAGGEKNGQSAAHPAVEPRKAPFHPFEQDQYSGKTLSDKKMVLDMVFHREANAPHVGEVAPEFSLKDGQSGHNVSLADLRQGKPVVLIMSSWGCNIFRETAPGLVRLHSQYKDRLQFVMIYIREAHALNGFNGFSGQKLGKVKDPKTTLERMAVAMTCKKRLALPFPLLIDAVDDRVMTRWAAWPVRIYVVGTDGKIAYAGPQGPWGYRPYRGFQHGDGTLLERDLQFSAESLQEFLEKWFPAKSLKAGDVPVDGSRDD